MYHMKEATIRSKIADISSHRENESSGSYAQETAEHYAGDSAAFAARAGTEMLIKSREHRSEAGSVETEAAIGSAKYPIEPAYTETAGSKENVRAMQEVPG